MQKAALQITVDEIEGMPVVRASGEVDLATAPTLQLVHDELTGRKPQALVFDFTGITYLDSSGLKVLLLARERLGSYGGQVMVISNASCVLKPLRLCGLDQMLAIFTTEQELREFLEEG
jgi:anti-anti-sigma factor